MKVRDQLIDAARRQRRITYTDVQRLLKEPRIYQRSAEMDALLRQISEAEHAAGRLMLSAVVVRKEADGQLGRPGSGFDELAKDLGANLGQPPDVFWKAEFRRVCAYPGRNSGLASVSRCEQESHVDDVPGDTVERGFAGQTECERGDSNSHGLSATGS
jgi:hypothetical protein